MTRLFRSVCRLIVQLLVCQMFCFPVGRPDALRKARAYSVKQYDLLTMPVYRELKCFKTNAD